MALDITLARAPDLAALETRWRALQAAASPSFFLGADFLFTAAPQRFPDPWLLSVRAQGQDLALGLFNRAGGYLRLHETGAAPWDGLFIEHNGLLLRQGHEAVLGPALRHAARRHRLVLSGVAPALLAAGRAAGWLGLRARRDVPVVDLAVLPQGDAAAAVAAYVQSLSPGTRAQIRRAWRRAETQAGAALRITAAADNGEAEAFFTRLVALHQARWQAAGQPGAFADPAIIAFHRALIARAHPAGGVALLRVSAGEAEIGYLYNLRAGTHVMNYQAGLVAAPHAQDKPGLLCHAMAIGLARADGARAYDLLAGQSRYKSSLLTQDDRARTGTLLWAALYPWADPRGAMAALRARLRPV